VKGEGAPLYKNKNMRKGKTFGDVRYQSSNLIEHYIQILYHIATSPFTFKIEKFILFNCSNKPNQQKSIKKF
jgi:hypothetical protein